MNAKLTETLHGKNYDDAVRHATKLTELKGVTEDIKATCAEALATHPGNPVNAKPEAEVEEEAEPSEEDVAAQLEAEQIDALRAKYGSRDAVLAAIAAQEFNGENGNPDVAMACKVISAFDPPAARAGNVFCKVSGKGGISLYGLQRLPVTLYAEQWERMPKFLADIVLPFIKANEGKSFEAPQYAKDASGKMVKTGKSVTTKITRKSRQAAA